MKDTSITHRNIRAICEMEQEALNNRSRTERFGDLLVANAGKLWFIALHAVWFGVWMVLNTAAPRAERFDPYPFSLLTMVVSLESIFLSLFIMMSQARSNLQADRRNHLDLQINLLSEDENTKVLQMLQALCEYHGLKLGKDPEISQMAKETQLKDVLEDLKTHLPSPE